MYEIRAGVQTFENVLIMAACLLIRTDRWRMIMSKSLELQIVSECAPTLAGIKRRICLIISIVIKKRLYLNLTVPTKNLIRRGCI